MVRVCWIVCIFEKSISSSSIPIEMYGFGILGWLFKDIWVFLKFCFIYLNSFLREFVRMMIGSLVCS
ncbi:MAG: hypothetical protein BWY55_00443 [archaeon ADurb.Bin336]|nr:MAG: hypothetical protein BWY55_00443 [archaeon ADurb.Bin336]